jgi:hypothetical protein
MNPISNIWNHPRTSVAGVLISVATVAGVLAQQGITLGTAGGGTVVTLASALATALLGLLARDPGTPAAQPAASCAGDCGNCGGNSGGSNMTSKLSAWMLIALLLPLPWMQGCNASSVAQDIVNWTPSLQSAIATVDSTAALLAPADASAFTVATSGFDAASNLLVGQAQAYLANPSADTLGKLQAQIVLLQQQVNAALLSAAHIVDEASQRHALAAIQAVATIVNAILSLVQSVSSKAQVAQMAAQSTIKLAAVAPYLDGAQSARIVAEHYDEPVGVARMQVAKVEREETAAGF